MIVIFIIFTIVVFAIATYALGTLGLAQQRARILAVTFAAVFVAGAAAHRLVERRPDPAAIAPADAGASVPKETSARPAAVEVDVQNLPTTGSKTTGSVDVVEVTKANALHVRGWALTNTSVPGPALVAVVDGKKRIDLTKIYGQSRPDVALSLKKEAARPSGFDGFVPIAGLPPGSHTISIGVASDDGTSLLFPANADRTFALR